MTIELAELAELADRAAITDTLQQYARCIDVFDFDGVGDCFTSDAVATYSKYAPFTSGAALAEFLQERTASTAWHQHFLSVVSIEIHGDTAETLTYFIAHAKSRDEPVQLTVQAGEYRDALTRTANGWKISTRRQSTGLKEVRPLG